MKEEEKVEIAYKLLWLRIEIARPWICELVRIARNKEQHCPEDNHGHHSNEHLVLLE